MNKPHTLVSPIEAQVHVHTCLLNELRETPWGRVVISEKLGYGRDSILMAVKKSRYIKTYVS